MQRPAVAVSQSSESIGTRFLAHPRLSSCGQKGFEIDTQRTQILPGSRSWLGEVLCDDFFGRPQAVPSVLSRILPDTGWQVRTNRWFSSVDLVASKHDEIVPTDAVCLERNSVGSSDDQVSGLRHAFHGKPNAFAAQTAVFDSAV